MSQSNDALKPFAQINSEGNRSMAEYMTEQEASAYVRVASSTLKSKRSKGQGPKCQRAGGRIIYSKAELDSWIRSGLL